jgi:phosphoribosylformylglycinamidine synthase PurS subunit
MAEVEVFITLKNTVADPQGLAVKHALENLGYREVEDVRVGKIITIKLKADNKKALESKIEQMCKKLLANPIIENYKFQIR